MKKTRFALLFLLIPIALFSQTFEKLKSDTQKIGDANYNMDFDVVANLTYPKVYEASGKSAFIEKLDSDYQNAEFRMRLEIVNPLFQYSEMKTIEGKKFYTITYKNPTRYFYEKKMDAATAQKKRCNIKGKCAGLRSGCRASKEQHQCQTQIETHSRF